MRTQSKHHWLLCYWTSFCLCRGAVVTDLWYVYIIRMFWDCVWDCFWGGSALICTCAWCQCSWGSVVFILWAVFVSPIVVCHNVLLLFDWINQFYWLTKARWFNMQLHMQMCTDMLAVYLLDQQNCVAGCLCFFTIVVCTWWSLGTIRCDVLWAVLRIFAGLLL